MIRILPKLSSLLGLLIMLIPSILLIYDSISEEKVNVWVMIGTVLWFLSASFWMGRKGEDHN
jgi:hypothetical protein